MAPLKGTALAEKLTELTEDAAEKTADAVASAVARAVVDGGEEIGGIPMMGHNARYMMVAVATNLFASAVKVVIDSVKDEGAGQRIAVATDNMLSAIIGPLLVELHKLAKDKA